MVRGIDLRTMGLRRLRAALRGLPPEALRDVDEDPLAGQWSATVDLLATLAEVCSTELINVQRSLGQKKTNDPVKITRPGQQRPKGSGVSMGEFRKLVGKGNVQYVPDPEGGGEPA